MSAVPDSAFDEFDEELSEKLLWEQLKGKIEEAEWDAVQRMLGHDVIDRNQELNTEAEMLREILNAYRAGTVDLERNVKPPLPEANPLGKQLLQKEISFFLGQLRQRGARRLLDVPTPRGAGGAPDSTAPLSLSTPSEEKVYRYITGDADGGTPSNSSGDSSRPGTVNSLGSAGGGGGGGGSRPGSRLSRSRPGTAGGRSSRSSRSGALSAARLSDGGGSGGSSSCQAVEAVEAALANNASGSGSLDMMSIHTVTEHIKEALRDETTALMVDIEHLNVCLEEAAGERAVVKENVSSRMEPTRAELESFSKKLQAEIDDDDMADILDGTGLLSGLGGSIGGGGELASPVRPPPGAGRAFGAPPLGQLRAGGGKLTGLGPLSVGTGAGGGLYSGAHGGGGGGSGPSPLASQNALALGGASGRPGSSRRVNRLRSMVEDTR